MNRLRLSLLVGVISIFMLMVYLGRPVSPAATGGEPDRDTAVRTDVSRTNDQTSEGTLEAESVNSNVTLVGTYACLPYVDAAAPKATCARGLKTDTGLYYAVNFVSAASYYNGDFTEGMRVSVVGIVTAADKLVPDNWAGFEKTGLIVVASFEKL